MIISLGQIEAPAAIPNSAPVLPWGYSLTGSELGPMAGCGVNGACLSAPCSCGGGSAVSANGGIWAGLAPVVSALKSIPVWVWVLAAVWFLSSGKRRF